MIAAGATVKNLMIDDAGGGIWSVETQFRNAGNTATKLMMVKQNCFATNKFLPNSYTFKPAEYIDAISDVGGSCGIDDEKRMTIGPSQEENGPTNTLAIVDRRKDKSADYIILYIFGRAEYIDMLSPQEVHLTNYCFEEVSFTADVNMHRPIRWGGVTACATHNCYDKECSKEDLEQARSELLPDNGQPPRAADGSRRKP